MTVAEAQPLGPAAAAARVAQLQALIAGARGGAPAPAPAGGFQAELAAATAGLPAGPAPIAATAGVGGAAIPFAAEIDAAAARHGIDPALLRALIRAESNFDPNAVSPAGAQGLTQLMPGTARSLGVTNPFDPVQAIEGGARYLRQALDRFGGDPRLALAAYNAGPGAVERYGGVPPYAETRAYVERVLGYMREYAAAGSRLPGALPAAGQAAVAPPSTRALTPNAFSTV